MTSLVEHAVVNAVTVTALAVLVFAASRFVRRPALRHALWVLLLVKLVTPPLVTVPTGLNFPRLFGDASVDLTPHQAPLAVSSRDARVLTPMTESGVPSESALARQASPTPVDVPLRSTTTAAASFDRSEIQRGTTETSTSFVTTAPADVATRWTWKVIVPGLLAVWFAGTVAWFAWQGWRAWRFQRSLKRLAGRSGLLSNQTRQLAFALELKQCPEVWVVPGVVSPMLWGVGRRVKLLFPEELLTRLDVNGRATLLTHELAHFCRGDHWVRLLELVVCGLFWWHPVVWWVLSEIEAAEEECCDAWVVNQFPSMPRCYAEALLDTIDFLCETSRALPPVASGLGGVPDLRQRLQRIMCGSAPKALSRRGRFALVAVLALLPVHPGFFDTLNRRAQANSVASLPPSAAVNRLDTDAVVPLNSLDAGRSIRAGSPEGVVNDSTANRITSPVGAGTKPAAQSGPREPQVWATAMSPDRRFQLLARTGRRVELLDTVTDHRTDLTDWHVAVAEFAAHGRTFVTGGYDRQIRLWETESAKAIAVLGQHSDAATSVSISPDGHSVVSGSRDGMLKLWDAARGDEKQSLEFHSPINCVRFSPDGRLLAVATGNWRSLAEGRVKLIDAESWFPVADLTCRTPAGAVAFLENGNVLATGAWDGSVTYWNLSDRTPLVTTITAKDTISAAAFSTDTRVFPQLSLPEAQAQVERERQRRFDESAALIDGVRDLLTPVFSPRNGSTP